MSTVNKMIAGCMCSSILEPSSQGWWVSFAVLVPVIVVVLVAFFFRKRFRYFRQKKIGEELSLPTIEGKESGSQELDISKPVEIEWPSPNVTDEGVSQEWGEFVTERLEELRPQQDIEESKWALGIVDFLDELKESESEASSAERSISTSLQNELLNILSTRGFALVDSEAWSPDLQRAVAVVRKPDAIKTTILKKGSTGLSRNGKIIRKQEVKIEMKGN